MEWLVPDLWQVQDKVSLGHLVPIKKGCPPRLMGSCQKDTKSQLEEALLAKFGTI